MTTALTLMANVYLQANLDQDLTSFATSQEYPYNIAQHVLNEAIDELNELGRYRFMLKSTALTYSAGVNTYSFSTIGVDPESIIKIERTLADNMDEIQAMNLDAFRQRYRRSATQTTTPTVWTDYGDTLEFNTIPDKDYSIVVWHYDAMAQVSATSDVLDVPSRHEHVLRDMAYSVLLRNLGRPDAQERFATAQRKAGKLLANTHNLRSRPTKMPRGF